MLPGPRWEHHLESVSAKLIASITFTLERAPPRRRTARSVVRSLQHTSFGTFKKCCRWKVWYMWLPIPTLEEFYPQFLTLNDSSHAEILTGLWWEWGTEREKCSLEGMMGKYKCHVSSQLQIHLSTSCSHKIPNCTSLYFREQEFISSQTCSNANYCYL